MVYVYINVCINVYIYHKHFISIELDKILIKSMFLTKSPILKIYTNNKNSKKN